MTPALLTVKEVAERLRASRGYVMSLIYRRQLPAVRLPGETPRRSGRVLVREQALCEFLERCEGDGR